MVSFHPSIFKSFGPFTKPLWDCFERTDNNEFRVHIPLFFFLVLKQGRNTYLSFRFLLFSHCGLPGRQSLLFCKFSFFIETRLTKAWTAINRLSTIWKSDLTDKMKRSFFQAAVTSILLYGCTTWTLTKRLEKKLDGNYTRMLRAILNKSWQRHPTRHQLYGHLPPITKSIQVRRTRHAGHCWRSRDELIKDVLLWIPTHGRAKAGRPARTYIQQLCEDTGCCPEDLPRAMNDREEWRKRVRDIRAASTIWWWWWWSLGLVVWPGVGNRFVSQNTREFCVLSSQTDSGLCMFHFFELLLLLLLLLLLYTLLEFITIIIIICEFFTTILTSRFSLKSERQQSSSSPLDSPKYSWWCQPRCDLYVLNSSFWFPILPVSFPNPWDPFQAHQIQLVASSTPYSTASSTLWQDPSICLRIFSLSFIFTRWFAGTVKSTRYPFLFFNC